MQYLGVIVFCICIFHYVYQTILLPSFRAHARDELFVLRDALRTKLLEKQDECDSNTLKAFKEVDDSINRSLNRLHLLNFWNFVKFSAAVRENPDLNNDFKDLLESAGDQTPRDVYVKAGRVLGNVLLVNSAMFLLYILPIAIVIELSLWIYRTIKGKGVDFVRKGADVLIDSCLSERNDRDELSAKRNHLAC
ncbi:hypothetical protein [Shewanella algae]|uniref:hypothetical protein n=1 Tax=Shewanella algae TaxID=38313 RepID=UPI001183858A|nr:hypothetical protein [Shewanella algae]TVL14792.1 hypothetical protein AYJ02_12060 [Shewanella algae]